MRRRISGHRIGGCNPRYHAWLGLFAIRSRPYTWRWVTSSGGVNRKTAATCGPFYCAPGWRSRCLTLAVPVQFTAYRITMAWSLEAAAFSWIGSRCEGSAHDLGDVGDLSSGVAAAGGHRCLDLCRTKQYTAVLTKDSYVCRGRVLYVAGRAVGAEPAPLRLAYYIAGHWPCCGHCTQEVLGWAGRKAAAENLVSVETISVSILYACYAICFRLGCSDPHGDQPIGGLFLIGVVVLKLYVFDVWQLGRFYRTLAFVALGVLLLSTSFLYSHFRGFIETWWKKEV